MSWFGGGPDPFQEMDRQMNAMMGQMSSAFPQVNFGHHGMGQQQQQRRALSAGPSAGGHQIAHHQSNTMMPFGGGFGPMFGNMDSMFQQMGQMQQQMGNNPNMQSYSSSKVISYSNTGNGAPKVYEATSETRHAPGGIKQTKESERNSETGLHRMAVGHHINDRGHVVEKSRNKKTGDEEENQEYLNMDEAEKDRFHQEWQQKANSRGALGGGRALGGGADRHRVDRHMDNRHQTPYRHHQQQQQHHQQPRQILSAEQNREQAAAPPPRSNFEVTGNQIPSHRPSNPTGYGRSGGGPGVRIDSRPEYI